MLRIGLLTPRSSLYPTMGFDVLNGLKTGLAHKGISDTCTLFTDNIGFGTDEAEVYSKAEKMLLGENADIVITCCDSRVAAMLQPLFTATGKLLLVTNPGANLPEGWQTQPTTIIHSLNFCFSTALTGARAAAHEKGALATSYYDAGYNQVYCMLTAFQQKGGSILYNHITHLKMEAFTLQPLQEFMASENGTQNLLCLFSADMAAQFYRTLAALPHIPSLRLFVSPMMLEEGLIAELKNEIPAAAIEGYTPWLSILSNENNQQFTAACQDALGKMPNLFTLLGWDNALIADEFARQLHTHGSTAAAVKAMAAGGTIASPRGWIKLDPATGHIYGPAWLVQANAATGLSVTDSTEPETGSGWNSFTAGMVLNENELHSAWRNTYLCI